MGKWISRSVTTEAAFVGFTLCVFLLLMDEKRRRSVGASGGTGTRTMTERGTSTRNGFSVIAARDQSDLSELSWLATDDDRAWVRMVAPSN